MTGKQLSISVSNLTTSLNTHRRNSAVGNLTESTDEQRKHALSDESLPSMVRRTSLIDRKIFLLFCQ